ncbi:MAG: hypothetical protein A2Z52_02815 [Candidatus Moranbacteria bacterium RBG_19FT_COMBO_42_6]|nr:MAG: hypothetical protein A2Z52_02815 [Candidatus Moranbacteria bacterium RBG_19FT_COMBO_42_6]
MCFCSLRTFSASKTRAALQANSLALFRQSAAQNRGDLLSSSQLEIIRSEKGAGTSLMFVYFAF